MQVLVVDDDKEFCDNLATRFRQEGWGPKVAYSGMDAVRILHEWYPDVIIMDMKMEEMDGFRTQQEVLKIHPDACIVFLTGYADVEHAVQAIQQGATDFCEKPTEFPILLARSKKAARDKKAQIDSRAIEQVLLAVSISSKIQNIMSICGPYLYILECSDLSGDCRQAVKRIAEKLKATQESVRYLLAAAKGVAPNIEVVSLLEIAEQARKKVREMRDVGLRGPGHPVIVEFDEDVAVLADKVLLTEALECLVDNALEFGGPEVQVGIGCQPAGDTVRLTVRDNGGGFLDTILQERYDRIKTTAPETHWGFGLSFVRLVAERCGGALEFGNSLAPDGGAYATVLLRAAPRAGGEPI